MSRQGGLRERKKQQTYELIADTARRLFNERGFEAVTVADVAREADVAEKTVFNYFPTKEDLFYSHMESFEAELLEAIGRRPPEESVLAAFRRFLMEPRGMFAQRGPGEEEEAAERLLAITRTITSSPALLAREQQVIRRYTDSLAALIRAEKGADDDDVESWVVANALMGVHRALIDFVRAQVLAGVGLRRAARNYRRQGRKALALLERGLATYGLERPASSGHDAKGSP